MADRTAEIEVSHHTSADAEVAWSLISDITRMGEWSPEATGGTWLKGARGPAAGAKFRGTNRSGFRRWYTICTVTECEPGEAFAFRVSFGPVQIADWAYHFEPSDGGGCTIVETWQDRRPPGMGSVTNFFLGISDRAEHNRAGMQKTLQRLAEAAEAKHDAAAS